MMKLLLLSAALLLLLPAAQPEVSFLVVVHNDIHNQPLVNYTTSTVDGGILLGGLRRLMNSSADFTFGYHEDPNFGPFLDSVNGLAGNASDHTYWELLVRTPDGPIIETNVGIGCYIPNLNDEIILNFTRW